MKKGVVLKNNNQQEVYQWLTDSTKRLEQQTTSLEFLQIHHR
jgi:hypothetical protein